MKSKIKTSFDEIVSKTTIHGLPNILNARRLIIRSIWILSTLLAAAICFYLIISSVRGFFKFDVVSRIEEWPKNPFEFPTVSFCNQNQPITNYTLDDLILTCMFNGRECSANNFTQFLDLNYGVCYRFNTEGILSVNRPGKINGLQLDLFVGLGDDYIGIGSTINGLHVYINNHSYLPSINEGIDVSTGFRTNIVVKKVFTNKLSSPYNDCEEDPKYFKSKIFNGIKEFAYRQRDCFDLKFLEYFSQKCNLTGNMLEIFKLFRTRFYEQNSGIFNCLLISNAEFYSQNVNELFVKDCPNECNSIGYTATTSMSNYPSNQLFKSFNYNLNLKNKLLKLFKGEFSLESFRESTASFIVYYEDLKYTQISQDPKTSWLDLVSNIGGLLGLFLGMSFLSLIEIVEFIMEIFFILFEKKCIKSSFKI